MREMRFKFGTFSGIEKRVPLNKYLIGMYIVVNNVNMNNISLFFSMRNVIKTTFWRNSSLIGMYIVVIAP